MAQGPEKLATDYIDNSCNLIKQQTYSGGLLFVCPSKFMYKGGLAYNMILIT